MRRSVATDVPQGSIEGLELAYPPVHVFSTSKRRRKYVLMVTPTNGMYGVLGITQVPGALRRTPSSSVRSVHPCSADGFAGRPDLVSASAAR